MKEKILNPPRRRRGWRWGYNGQRSNIAEPPEHHTEEQLKERRRLHIQRAGILTAITIVLHNFPEGLATFSTSIHDMNLGVVLTIEVAIHNIPEGISVALPFYYATGKKRWGILYSLLSGLAEPLAAVLAAIFLHRFFSPTFIAGLIGIVAGIMVYISLDEILPSAQKACENDYGEKDGHSTGLGIICGMLIMAVSLVLLE